jgi:DNA-binding NarL/FixJ family response regulator
VRRRRDGGGPGGAHAEVVTAQRLVLLVALSTSRWGRHFRRSIPSQTQPRPLSEREREVVRLVAEARTGPEIADELHIAHDTVRTHVRNAMTKLGARSRAPEQPLDRTRRQAVVDRDRPRL